MSLRETRLGKRYLGDRAFYALVLALVVPVIIQNSITNFVSLLDNLMVSSVNTQQLNGVSIGNNLMFVFNLCVFGGLSVSSIFAAQFYGAEDEKGMRHCFRHAMYIALGISAVGLTVLGLFRGQLVDLYINDVDVTGGAEETWQAAMDYCSVMMLGMLPFAISQAYAGILRVTGETKLPMAASVISVLTNLAFNYILIFGHFGFPALQAKGAAVATVIARTVEMLIILIVSHRRVRTQARYAFLRGAYRSFYIPGELLRQLTVKGLPLLVNEGLWSMGIAVLNQQYSQRGLTVVSTLAISTTITNLFNTFFLSQGTAASVLVGRALGAEDAEEARGTARRVTFFTLCVCVAVGLIMIVGAPFLPRLFREANETVRALATKAICVYALATPLMGFCHCAYFILRAGGRTGITFLFDSAFMWLLPIPLVYALVHFTELPFIPIFAAYYSTEFVKDILGYVLLKKGIWIRNIVSSLK